MGRGAWWVIVHGVYRVEHNLATKPPDHLQGQVMGFPGGSDSKESVCNTGDQRSTPGLERSPGEGNGNRLHYYCLGNPMDREV